MIKYIYNYMNIYIYDYIYIILYIGLYGLYMDYNSLSFLKPLSIREMHIQVTLKQSLDLVRSR